MSLSHDIIELAEYLFNRWRDEWMYEDFDEYIDHAKKKVEADGAEFIHLKKQPFVLGYKKDGDTYDVRCDSRKVTVTQINK